MSNTDRDVKRHIDVLYRYCLTLTRSNWEAEDVMQEALLRAMPLLNGEREHANPAAFLMRTAKNVWIDQTRRRQMAERQVGKRTEQADQGIHLDDHGFETERVLGVLAERLSPLQLTVFLLRDVFQYSAAETAERLRTSEGAVKAALHRARRGIEALRQRLARDEDEQAASVTGSAWFQAYLAAFRRTDPEALAFLAFVQDAVMEPVEAVSHMNRLAQSGSHAARSASVSPYALFAAA